ncbi:MAG: VWA domain-containing protein [Acidimicrobiia bacterium]|nr:VWA domain-containing protein [Acidimicrobiia bacterium]NDE81035.1 VWA domain-containing protein [Actinomycetota bacterium]
METVGTNTSAERMAVAFSRVLRGAGIATPIGNVITFTESITRLGIDRRDDVYWAGRATLIRRPEDIGLFDRAFEVFWNQRRSLDDVIEETLHLTINIDADEGSMDDGQAQARDDEDDGSITLRFSSIETLRSKDFAAYSPEELHLAQELMSRLRLVGTPRSSFRMVPGSRRGRPDLRRTVRSSLRTAGEPITRHHLENDRRLRRLVLLLDISGSMEPYARALLRFVQAAVAGRQKVEAFAIGTRLTRVTRELGARDPDKALRLASHRVQDWSGGTRLGDCLREFNDQWGVRGMARGAIVVVLSDGWDRGDPDVLAEQMRRLQRVSHRTIWVNPLKVTPGYAPLARGMAAAMPFIDRFVEGHSLDAMEQLAREIGG